MKKAYHIRILLEGEPFIYGRLIFAYTAMAAEAIYLERYRHTLEAYASWEVHAIEQVDAGFTEGTTGEPHPPA